MKRKTLHKLTHINGFVIELLSKVSVEGSVSGHFVFVMQKKV